MGEPSSITVDELREIIAPLLDPHQDKMPKEPELSVLAATLTGGQYCNLPPEEEFKALGFPMRLTDVLGNEYVIKAPLWPDHPPVDWVYQKPVDWEDRKRSDGNTHFGHPRPYRKDWRDITDDIVAALQKAMGKANPERKYSRGSNFVIDFVFAVSPRILSRPWSRSVVKQWLVQPYPRKRRKPLAPPRQTVPR
jgi:hypothetical protein